MSDAELDSLTRAVVLAAQVASPGVRLVGGAGLALLLGHRKSEDVDLFAAGDEPLQPIIDAVTRAAEEAGASVARVRTTPRFVRLEATAAGATLRIDIANDASPRLERTPPEIAGIRVESLRDQRANKLVAVLGRSELRDLVDLFFLEREGLPAVDGLEDARQKDGGVDPAWLAWAIDQIAIRPLPGMLVSIELESLRAFRDELRDALLDRAGARTP